MKIEVEISRKDYSKFNDYVVNKKMFGIPYIIFYLIFIGTFFLDKDNRYNNFSTYLVMFFIITVSCFISIFIFRYIMSIYAKTVPFKKGGVLGKHTFEVSKEGFKESTQYNETLTKWEGINSVEENKNYIFVFIDRHIAHVIPKRYFATKEEVQGVLSSLKNYIAQAKNQTIGT